ncbi:hypothetical protein GCM10009557_84410 [Virgisporangium ochraceum]
MAGSVRTIARAFTPDYQEGCRIRHVRHPESRRRDETLTIRQSIRRVLLSAVTAVTVVPLAVAAGAAPAGAATNQFRGMNWAVLGDNFSTGPLVLHGLSQSDSNATVRAKANALYDDMAAIGVNTVRLPINTHTVGTAAPPPAAGSPTSPRGTRCGRGSPTSTAPTPTSTSNR